jgi:hypothetical protein
MGHISYWPILMMADNINAIKKNTEALTDASKEAGL